VRREVNRPQPRLDRLEGRGMSVVVGRVREDRVLNGVKYVVLGHNTIRGAAGTGVLMAELLVKKGYI
jgi:aspartate-semialdehyde dehydrogenase